MINTTRTSSAGFSWDELKRLMYEALGDEGRTPIGVTEETPYNGGTFTDNHNVELGEVITLDINNPTSDISLSLRKYDFMKDDDKYAVTRYGTYLNEYDNEKVEIYYPEEAMELNFYIGEVTSSITTQSESIVTEGQVSKIIVGGTCINQAAANLLGVGRLCGADFTAATGVGVGQALIQMFADTDDKVAILVAGYETADTARAMKYVEDNYLDLTVGKKLII